MMAPNKIFRETTEDAHNCSFKTQEELSKPRSNHDLNSMAVGKTHFLKGAPAASDGLTETVKAKDFATVRFFHF